MSWAFIEPNMHIVFSSGPDHCTKRTLVYHIPVQFVGHFFIAPKFFKLLASIVKMASYSSAATSSTNITTRDNLAELEKEFLSEINAIHTELEKYNCLPKTFAEVKQQIDERKKKLEELRNARDTNGTTQSNGTSQSNWIVIK